MDNITKIKNQLWKSSCSWWFAYPPNIYTTKKINNSEYFNNLLYWSKNSLNNKVWLFIYIPFCDYFCNFCIYFKLNKSNIDVYLNSLIKDIIHTSLILKQSNLELDNVYIWWWTPTSLNLEQLSYLVNTIKDNFDFSNLKQFAIEATPDSLDNDKINFLLNSWINRIWFWLQSVNNSVLDKIGRIHSVEQLEERISYLRTKNFNNIHVDIIIWLPEEDIFDNNYITNIVNYMKKVNPDHIWLYSYTDSWKRKNLVVKTSYDSFSISKVSKDLKYKLLENWFFVNNQLWNENIYEYLNPPEHINWYNRNSEWKYFNISVIWLGNSWISFLYWKNFFMNILRSYKWDSLNFSIISKDDMIRRNIMSDLDKMKKINIDFYKARYSIDLVDFITNNCKFNAIDDEILVKNWNYLNLNIDWTKYNAEDFFDIIYKYFYSDKIKDFLLDLVK